MGRRRAEWLTDMERQVLKTLLDTGGTNKQIAQKLIMSDRTVGVHLLHIYTKTGVNSRSELMARAMREGWEL